MLDPIDLHSIDWKDRLLGRDVLKDEINELRCKVTQYENAAMWADHRFVEREDRPKCYRLEPTYSKAGRGIPPFDGLYGPAR